MNEQETYQQLLQDVADLKQIVCELAKSNVALSTGFFIEMNTREHVNWQDVTREFAKTKEAIANRLNPINFCADCKSTIHYRIIPAWNQSGVSCNCPDKPLLNIFTLTAKISNSDQTATLEDWNIQFIPPDWLTENACDEAVAGQCIPDHLG